MKCPNCEKVSDDVVEEMGNHYKDADFERINVALSNNMYVKLYVCGECGVIFANVEEQ